MSHESRIGIGKPCFIIAEAGVNHNGNMLLAKKLVDIAADASADAVKFQTFNSKNVVTKYADIAKYQEENIGKKESQLDMIKKFELSYDKFLILKRYCDKKKIIFLSTPHSHDAIDLLQDIVPFYKVSSSDLTNIPFLKKIAKKDKMLIISTGMATLDEVKEAVRTIEDENNKKIVLLHCTTSYPCQLKDVNLNAMKTIMREFDYPVGYSDHTLGYNVSKLAVREGASVLEKHFTIDKNMKGPDHKASLNPEELKELVRLIRNKELDGCKYEDLIMGSYEKKPTKEEIEISKFVRKSIVANIDIFKGTTITEEMLVIKRPGWGIKPKYINKVIGNVAKRTIKQDTVLTEEDLV
jgi:N-acetylneuraminate synthase